MRKHLKLMKEEDFDLEVNALAVCFKVLKPLGFDGQWRVLNYLLVRLLNRTWALAKPVSDTK